MGENSINVRKSNKNQILSILYREGEMTRMDIAMRLGLSLTTVSTIMRELQDDGLLVITGQKESTGGRKPTAASLRPDGKVSIGLRVSKHHVRFALLNLGNNILEKESYSIPFEESDEYWEYIHTLADGFRKKYVAKKSRLLGFGIAFPGIVSEDNTKLLFAPTLKSGEVDLKKLRDYFEEPLIFANDGELAGKAEQWFTKTNEVEIYLLLSSGVGGTIIADEKYKSLFGHKACEFGHMSIIKNGRQCSCGRLGCLEAYCSSLVIPEQSKMPIDDFFLAIKNGSSSCEQIWNEYLDNLTLGIDNIVNIFDRPIVIGGEMSQYIKIYRSLLIEKLKERTGERDIEDKIRISNYSDFDSAIGAALLHIESFLKNQ